jgi:hypothetical protein
MKKKLLPGDLNSMPPKITRALEDGPDYRPDWRHLQVQEYLNSIYQPDAEALTRLDEILAKESDPFVRDLLLFHCGRPCGNEDDIAYAVNCQRDNYKTLSASAIKALVIANVIPERIAHEFGATKEKIEIFEKLYFDARRYLKHRGWLRGICYPAAKPDDAASAAESRWFPVAFRRGWPGVEEVVLGRVPKSGERTLHNAFSVLLGRVEDLFFGWEASGAALSEKDIKAMESLARISARGLPYLWENPLEQESSTDSPTVPALKKLSPVQRDMVRAFLGTVIDAAEKKALAQKSEGSKTDGPATNCSETCS